MQLDSWTELGSKHVGIIQSLLSPCGLQVTNPYGYFVDVLQRIGQHPASLVNYRAQRIWEHLFAANLLRSSLHVITPRRPHVRGASLTPGAGSLTRQLENNVAIIYGGGSQQQAST